MKLIVMNKFSLKKDTLEEILKAVDTVKNDKNKIRFLIGMCNAGKGLACKAVIVNGGVQVEVGFTTNGIPKDFEEGKPLTFAVKATDFSIYASRLLSFGADVELSVSETSLTFKVGTLANISISLVSADECEPLLPNLGNDAFLKAEFSKDKFLTALKQGGYRVQNEDDNTSLKDRVVLSFEKNKVTVLSTDSQNIAHSWCDINAEFFNPMLLMNFDKLSVEERTQFSSKMKELSEMNLSQDAFNKLSDEEKAEYVEKATAGKKFIEDFMKKAESQGFVPDSYKATLDYANYKALCRLIGNGTTVKMKSSSRYMTVVCGNVCITLAQAGIASHMYEMVLKTYGIDTYPCRCVVDRDQLINAISVLAIDLNRKPTDKVTKPCELNYRKEQFVVEDSTGNKMRVLSEVKSGDFDGVSLLLPCEKLILALSHMPAGNTVLLMDNGAAQRPLVICNGDIEGEGLTTISYVSQVNRATVAKNAANKKAKQAEASEEKTEVESTEIPAEETVVENEAGSAETANSSEEDISKMAADGNIGIEEELVV